MKTNDALHAANKAHFLTRNEKITALLAAQTIPFQLFTNLIGYWPAGPRGASGQLIDLGGQGLTMSYSSASAVYYGLLPVANFNGSARLYRASETILNNSNPGFSAGCWVKFDNAAGSNEYIMSKWLTTGNQRSWLLFRNTGGAIAAIINSTGNSADNVALGGSTVDEDTWAHVALTFSPSSTLRVYVNGEYSELTTGVPATFFNSTADLVFGAASDDTSHMTGKACQWWLARRALEPGHIQLHYQYTKALFE